jgi:uncharacterized protein (DUF2236 family)
MTLVEPHVERPVSDAALPRRRSRRARVVENGMFGIALLAGPANVIMQLARPGVGYGVLESRVESGRVDRHPIKRARTTFTYIAVAINGTDAQKAAYKRAVNAYRTFVGELDDETADRHFLDSRNFGTTLQMRADQWPADRKSFDEFWERKLDEVHIDDALRAYLWPIAAGRSGKATLPAPLQRRIDGIGLLITTGFLPQRFRDEMQLSWDTRRQRRFDRLMSVLRVVNLALPGPIREFPFNVLLKDLDWRIRTGRPLV